jgi:phosphoglycerate-specific signal transduction histidine kinase
MAVTINIPGVGDVTADNFAQEDTLQKLLAAMSKSERTKRKEETDRIAQEKKIADLKKKEEEQLKKSTTVREKVSNGMDKLIANYKNASESMTNFSQDVDKVAEDISNTFANMTVTVAALAGKFIKNYDTMAAEPIKAGAGILEMLNNVASQVANIFVDVGVALGKAALGWVP